MSTIVPGLFNINGVIDTNQSVLQNIQAIAEAAGCWMTYDINDGQWAVVINRPGTAVASFNDSNIVGSINIFGSGINEMYNAVSIEFPHKDLRDQTDYIDLEIPLADRFPNELDNRLNISSNLINDPIQAQYAASIALKQTRADKIIEFTTDYTSLGLKAGDLISVTSSMVNYTAKMFRIISMSENDEDVISVTIRALEYDAAVYSTAGLIRKERNKKTGIVPKASNAALTQSDAAKTAQQVNTALRYSQQQGQNNRVLSRLFGKQQQVDVNGQPVFDVLGNPIYSDVIVPEGQEGLDFDQVLSIISKPAITTIATSSTSICAGNSVLLTFSHTCSSCFFSGVLTYNYTITGVNATDINIPLTGTFEVSTATNSSSILISVGSSVPNKVMTITVGGVSRSIIIHARPDYTYTTTINDASIGVNDTATVTLTTTGSKLNAVIPYAITGSGTAALTTALTGTVTASGGVATLALNTGDDFYGTGSVTVKFDGATIDYCGLLGDRDVNCTITGHSYTLTESADPITEGDSVTLTINATGPRANTTLNYAITGTAVGKITTALTGTVTVSGGVGTLTVQTVDDSIYTGNQSFQTVFSSGSFAATLTSVITVLDNESPPPADTTCIYVAVPAVLCAIYEGGTGELKGLTVRRTVQLPVAQAGEASVAVPLTFSVTKGNPSTINVLTTVNVATSAALGGFPINIVTSYNTIPPLGLLTGAVQTIYGYF
jgi:hypothetical protein